MTYYEVLGVDPDASPAQIRRAYVSLARTYHPDFHTTADPEVHAANERAMQAVNEAWTALSDPDARRRYDARLRSIDDRPPGGSRRTGSPWVGSPQDAWRRARADADERARAAWRPYDTGDGGDGGDDIDPRLLEDEPARVPVSRRRQLLLVAPTVAFFVGVVLVLLGLVVNLLPLSALGLAAIALSALAFLVLPLVALSASARNDRR